VNTNLLVAIFIIAGCVSIIAGIHGNYESGSPAACPAEPGSALPLATPVPSSENTALPEVAVGAEVTPVSGADVPPP